MRWYCWMLAVHIASIALSTIGRLAYHKATLGGLSHLIIAQPKHKTLNGCHVYKTGTL